MRILVTNDDGIDSIGLHVLVRAMCRLDGGHEIVVAAPDTEYSGAGASLGALHLIRPEVRVARIEGCTASAVWAVTGPPALCVMFSRLGAFGEPFDLVVSGINPGANVGRAVYHSGTVGAALTARNGHISGVAISQSVAGFGVEGQAWDEAIVGQHWESAAEIGRVMVQGLSTTCRPNRSWSTSTCPTSRWRRSRRGSSASWATSRRDRWRPRRSTRYPVTTARST